DFVARPARETRALRLRNICRRRFLGIQISVARREHEIGDWLRAQFRFQSLRLRGAEVKRLEKSVEPDHVRQVIVKIGQANRDAPATAGPDILPDTDVPAKIALRFQSKI